MKTIKYIAIAAVLLLAGACDRGDKSSVPAVMDGSDFSDATPLDAKIKEMYNKYRIIFKYDYTASEATYDWTQVLPLGEELNYTPADKACALQVLTFLEEEVFSVFPPDFIADYLPPVILLAGQVLYSWEYVDEIASPAQTLTKVNELDGYITSSNLVIGHVNSSFTPSAALRDAWISLVAERCVNNIHAPGYTDFIKVTNPTPSMLVGYYWNGLFPNINTGSASIGEVFDTPQAPGYEFVPNVDGVFWYKGQIRMGRMGYTGYEASFFAGLPQYGIPPSYSYSYAVNMPTMGQDFGDFVAFVTTKTAARKQAFYDAVDQKTVVRSGQAVYCKSQPFKDKVEQVKLYFLSNFNYTLPEPN